MRVSTIAHLIGSAVAGPLGGLVGGVAFGLLGDHFDKLVPALGGLLSDAFMDMGDELTRETGIRLRSKLAPQQLRLINHDLQHAFRQACREAIYDIGSPEIFPRQRFPDAVKSRRLVAKPIVFSYDQYDATGLLQISVRNAFANTCSHGSNKGFWLPDAIWDMKNFPHVLFRRVPF